MPQSQASDSDNLQLSMYTSFVANIMTTAGGGQDDIIHETMWMSYVMAGSGSDTIFPRGEDDAVRWM